MAGSCSLNAAAQPANVPPVPAKSQNAVDLAARLAEELRPGAQVVRPEVAPQPELVGPERLPLADDALRRRLHERQVAAGDLAGDGAGQLVHQHDLRAQRPHHPRPLDRVAPRHHRDERVALHAADDRQPRAGVAAGQLHDRLARRQQAVRLRVRDDLAGDAVFLGKAGVEVLQLGEDAAIEPAREAGQLDQRRLADGLDDGRKQVCRAASSKVPRLEGVW